MIRLTRIDDVAKLGAVERSAASVFRDVGLGHVADGEPMEPAFLARLCQERTLWVAVDEADEPVGFLAAHELDGRLFIAEVSVARPHQRQGLGRRLIAAAIAHAREAGFGAVSLTTDRELPWNGPYYARLGFAEVDVATALPGHREKLRSEAEMGLDPAKRCIMEMRLNPLSGA